jgi:SAM-dependent methyltransferase
MREPPAPQRTVPERFLEADRYRARREWLRYEGTPQRELLRRTREIFLGAVLRRRRTPFPRTLEVGSGPGRFSPILIQGSRETVVLDASSVMLREARRRLRGIRDLAVTRSSLVQGDAGVLPFPAETFQLVVALGNVVGFAEKKAELVLEELLRCVTSNGVVVIETVSPISRVPRFVERTGPSRWVRLLRSDPAETLPELLQDGFQAVPVPSDFGKPGEKFAFFGAKEITDYLEEEGFRVQDQLVAAPLTGGDPDLVRAIASAGPGNLERLLRWENRAGRNASLRTAGGHLLTSAVRTG